MTKPGVGRINGAVLAQVAGFAVVVFVAAGCSGSSKKAAPNTGLGAGTRVTSTTAVGGVVDSHKLAVALNVSLLTAAQVQQALGLPSLPTQEPPGGANAATQGPLTKAAIVSVLPAAAVSTPMYESAGGGVGANATYHQTTPPLVIDVLAVKFATSAGGQTFVQKTIGLATTLAQGRGTPSTGLNFGVLPADLQQVLRVPPGAVTDPTNETVAADVLYSDGVSYLLSVLAPPGTVTDAMIVALARAQNNNYLTARSTIDAS